MNKEAVNLIASAILVTLSSLYLDSQSEGMEWFRRSGSITMLIGIVLTYRSIVIIDGAYWPTGILGRSFVSLGVLTLGYGDLIGVYLW